MQKAQSNNYKHIYSGKYSEKAKNLILALPLGTHSRTQAVVKGMIIVGELPPYLAQSLVFNPAKYPIAMRCNAYFKFGFVKTLRSNQLNTPECGGTRKSAPGRRLRRWS